MWPRHIKGNWYTFGGGISFKIVLCPFWKGVFSKRKEFAPGGSKFFSYRVDTFPKAPGVQESKPDVIKLFL